MSGIGERLKLARSMARMSQQELADRADVSKMAISKYENNQMMPSSDVLLMLAEALGVRMEFLLRPVSELEIKPVYRKHSKMSKKAEQAVSAEILDWLERYLAIESFFPDNEVPAFSMPDGFPFLVSVIEDAEDAANALREAWSLGIDPIENLTELLEDKGIKVGLVEGDDNFDACTFQYDDAAPVIAVNRNRPGDRQRFDLAHELGHNLLEMAAEFDDERSYQKFEEKTAHRFAAAFLVPESAACMELGYSRRYLDPVELMMLKEKYGLSMNAWVYRAKDLGILGENDARNMFIEYRQRGWHKEEPGSPMPVEEPTRMQRLVRRLLAEDIVSRSRAAELLGERITIFLKQQEEALEVRN